MDSIGDTQVDVHSGYRSMRMAHEPPDELASSQVTVRTLRPHLLRFLTFFVVELALFFFWAICTAISAAGQVTNIFSGQTSGGGFFSGLSTLLGILLFLVSLGWLVSIFLPVREPIAEYGVLIENRASAVGHAFQWISYTIGQRRSPLQVGDASADGRGLMTLQNASEKAAVIVTPYGIDLYLGWTMWRQRSTVSVLIHMVRDMFETLRGGAYANDVRLADTRAFRELVHSVTREGAQAAISGGR